MALDVAKIEDRIDKTALSSTEVSLSVGGVKFSNMIEVMETAKMLAISGPAVPKWLQGNPGGCWAVIMQAVEWGFSPVSVARMSFEVNGVVGYMSQLLHAVVERRAPLQKRLRCDFEGEGAERVCIVTGLFKGEVDPLVYRSPPVGSIKVKNSPLWASDVDQQLWYYSSRAWCRRYAPDVLLGVYAKEELEEGLGPDGAKDVTPKPDIGARLPGKAASKRGFDPEHVKKESATIEGKVEPVQEGGPAAADAEPEPDPRAAAYNAGEDARKAGRPIEPVPADYAGDDALAEAYRDGWRGPKPADEAA